MHTGADNGVGKLPETPGGGTWRTALGLISGTSMDGIDVAVVDTDGVDVRHRPAFATYPYSDALRARLTVAKGRPPDGVENLAAIARDVTDANAEAVEDFLGRAGIDRAEVDVVGFHGQTTFHDPSRRLTCQLGDGARLARRLGIDVVCDFRSADVAAGGEGAPFASLYHAALARPLEPPLAVLNLGGVANVTWISPDGGICAFDTGPASAMIDDWVFRHTGRTMDEGGAIAHRGRVNGAALRALLDDPYFEKPYPKSLDRDHFDPAPIQGLSLEDGAATLVRFSAEAVRLAETLLPAPPVRWLVCGGGRHNPALMAALRDVLRGAVEPVEAAGWSGDAIEAQAFAFLAVRALDGLPLSVPATTGVPAPMPGGVVHRA